MYKDKLINITEMEVVRVKLVADLSQYDRKLVPGRVGTTRPPCTHQGKLNKQFVGVKFDIGPCLDIKWDQLEIIPD